MSPNPIFPANRSQLKAFSPVLDIVCADTQASYEKVKATRPEPAVADVAGAPYRACTIDSLKSIIYGDCRAAFDELIACNTENEYNYGSQCIKAREVLLECAAKNKVGELGKNYTV